MNDFDKLLILVKDQAKKAGVPISDNIDSHVIVNTRAKTRFGQCTFKNGHYTIELSSRLLNAPERSCRQTLAHELIHTCPGCGNHGDVFKKYADILNRRYGYTISRTNTAAEMGITVEQRERTVNYIIECQKCGQRITRSRFSSVIEHPSRYRCKCGGVLKRIK
ncbi:MAG: SprT-like domain-containing protein [Clostridia bacterium]|nr:SprT-like domain-containing protein [Clostridia bacterium]